VFKFPTFSGFNQPSFRKSLRDHFGPGDQSLVQKAGPKSRPSVIQKSRDSKTGRSTYKHCHWAKKLGSASGAYGGDQNALNPNWFQHSERRCRPNREAAPSCAGKGRDGRETLDWGTAAVLFSAPAKRSKAFLFPTKSSSEFCADTQRFYTYVPLLSTERHAQLKKRRKARRVRYRCGKDEAD